MRRLGVSRALLVLLLFTLSLAWVPACRAKAAAAGSVIEIPPVELRVTLSEHYRIRSDLEQPLVDDLARRMEGMYLEYTRRFATYRPDDAEMSRLEVYLFRRQEDYLKFTGERLKNTGGVYMPRRNLLAAFLDGQGRDGLRRTLQHEAFHQFAFNVISPNLPVWLNEGMAQMFEEGIWTGDGFWVGQAPPRRLRQLDADLKGDRLIDFDKMIAMTPDQWASNLTGDRDMGATEYNQSWAMVYFLTQAKTATGQDYRPRLLNMLRLIHDGKDGESAFREAFSDNFRGFQDRFVESAQHIKPTDEATLIERQSVLGDLLAELCREGKTFKDLSHFKRSALMGKYRMHYSKGALEWDTDRDLGVYFADIKGKALPPEQLYFDPRPGSPLPDIVCRCWTTSQLRTRFYANGDKIEHDIVVEPTR